MLKILPFIRYICFFVFFIKLTVVAFQCDTNKTLLGKIKVTCTKANCPAESVITIFEDGVFQKKYTYYSCKDSGQFLFFSKDGDTLTKSFFIANKTVGRAIYKFSNEKNKSILNYNNEGKKHGLCESWREDGTRKDSIVYNSGEIIEERVYFDNGQPRIWAKYSGVIKNVIEHFPDSSKLDKNFNPVINAVYFAPKSGKVIATVKNGSGRAIYYSEDGNSRFFCEYKNGEPISQRELKPGEMP